MLATHHLISPALYEEQIQAWREGPVVPALHQHHRQQYKVAAWPNGNPSQLSDEARSTVEWVAAKYGDYSATELSDMTHHELPWRAARAGLPDGANSTSEIRRDIMATYYSRQRTGAESAVTLATASAALEGVDLDVEWQDRLRDVATGVISADKLIADEIARADGV